MMIVIVTACETFGRTVSEAKKETMFLPTKGRGETSLTATALDQVYKQSNLCISAGLSAQVVTSVARSCGVCRGSGHASGGIV